MISDDAQEAASLREQYEELVLAIPLDPETEDPFVRDVLGGVDKELEETMSRLVPYFEALRDAALERGYHRALVKAEKAARGPDGPKRFPDLLGWAIGEMTRYDETGHHAAAVKRVRQLESTDEVQDGLKKAISMIRIRRILLSEGA